MSHHTFYDNILVASDYFRVSRTAVPFVQGYVECSRLETLVNYDFMDLVSGSASMLTS